jgi:hypothetical protein
MSFRPIDSTNTHRCTCSISRPLHSLTARSNLPCRLLSSSHRTAATHISAAERTCLLRLTASQPISSLVYSSSPHTHMDLPKSSRSSLRASQPRSSTSLDQQRRRSARSVRRSACDTRCNSWHPPAYWQRSMGGRTSKSRWMMWRNVRACSWMQVGVREHWARRVDTFHRCCAAVCTIAWRLDAEDGGRFHPEGTIAF